MTLKLSDKVKKILKWVTISIEIIGVVVFLVYLYRKLSGLKSQTVTSNPQKQAEQQTKQLQQQTQEAITQVQTTIKQVEQHQQTLIQQRQQTLQSKAQRDQAASSIFTVTDTNSPTK